MSPSPTAALTTYDYQVTFSSNNDYTVKRSDGTVMGSYKLDQKPAPEIDGFTLKLNGGALDIKGDSFKVSPTLVAATNMGVQMTDSSTLALAGPLVASRVAPTVEPA